MNVVAVTSLLVAAREHFLPPRLDIMVFDRESHVHLVKNIILSVLYPSTSPTGRVGEVCGT